MPQTWLVQNLAPLGHSIRSKTKTNRGSLAHVSRAALCVGFMHLLRVRMNHSIVYFPCDCWLSLLMLTIFTKFFRRLQFTIVETRKYLGSLRSKRFRGVGEQRKSENGIFDVLPARKIGLNQKKTPFSFFWFSSHLSRGPIFHTAKHRYFFAYGNACYPR